MTEIYMDHAATTPVRPEVLEAMMPYFSVEFGNASSIYSWGRRAHHGLDQARDTIAGLIGARPEEIVFTASGSEAANMALKGAAWGCGQKVIILLLPLLNTMQFWIVLCGWRKTVLK